MPRIIPKYDYTCYVCGTSFTIVNNVDFDPTDPASFEPLKNQVECPCCTAPVRGKGELTIGTARDLILSLYNASFAQDDYGDIDTFFESLVLTLDDVHTLLGIVKQLNYAAWIESVSTKAANNRESREELRVAKQAWHESQNGLLQPKLDALTHRISAKLEQQRANYLTRYSERCSAGQKPPTVVYRVPQNT